MKDWWGTLVGAFSYHLVECACCLDMAGQGRQQQSRYFNDAALSTHQLGSPSCGEKRLMMGGAVPHLIDKCEQSFNMFAVSAFGERKSQVRHPEGFLVCGVREVAPESERKLCNHLPRVRIISPDSTNCILDAFTILSIEIYVLATAGP